MCVYVGSDVVLANLLYYSPKAEKGINFADIEKYCFKIRETMAEKRQQGYIAFLVNDFQLENDLREYPDYFNRFAEKYYRGVNLQIEPFKKRVSPEISNVMRRVAQENS